MNIVKKEANESLVSWSLFIAGAAVITLALIAATHRAYSGTEQAAGYSQQTADMYQEIFNEEL